MVVAVLVLTGCSGSHDSTEAETSTSETADADAPSAYSKVMAQLPPFDEPASPEVSAYRRATIGAHAARCADDRGADKAAFVRANEMVLEQAGTIRRARLLSERAVAHGTETAAPGTPALRRTSRPTARTGFPPEQALPPSSRTTSACSTTAGSKRAA